MDDIFIMYDGQMKPDGDLPPVLTRPDGKGRAFVIPAPGHSRGMTGKGVRVAQKLTVQSIPALRSINASDSIIVGLGHDPEQKLTVKTVLSDNFPVLGLFKWKPLVPVFQKPTRAGSESYVEYFLIGHGRGTL